MPPQILRLTAPLVGAVGNLLLLASKAAAQGKPVETGSQWPVGLIFAGVVILGIVLTYGITRNRNRSRAEKQASEDVTAARYRNNTTAGE